MAEASAVKVEPDDIKPDIKIKQEPQSDEEMNDNNGNEEVKKLKIPRTLIQRVVGKDNYNIRTIASATGAQIEVCKEQKSSSTINIKGSKVATKRARELLTAVRIDPNIDINKLVKRPSVGECSGSSNAAREQGPVIVTTQSLNTESKQLKSGGITRRTSARLANKRVSFKRGIASSFGGLRVFPSSSKSSEQTSLFNVLSTAGSSKLTSGVQVTKDCIPTNRDNIAGGIGKKSVASLITMQNEPNESGSGDGLQTRVSDQQQPAQQCSSQATLRNNGVVSRISKRVSGPYCNPCKLEFTTNMELKVHSTVHGLVFQGLNEAEILGCTCGRTFTSRAKLDAHKENSFCLACYRCYKYPSGKRAHNLKHSNERKFVCEGCRKGYKRETNFALHVFRSSCSKKQLLGK